MLTSLVSLQQAKVKKSDKSIKMVNTSEKYVHNFWETWGISSKVSGKTGLMIILKEKKQGLSFSLEKMFLK